MESTRRDFILASGGLFASSALLNSATAETDTPAATKPFAAKTLTADVVVAGGGCVGF